MDDAWSRATVSGAKSAAVYGTLVNNGQQPVVIERIETAVADTAQVHESLLEGDMMRMKHLHHFSIGPGRSVELAPGGIHIMLMGVKENLSAGETFNIEIVPDRGQAIEVTVKIGQMGQMTAP
jgi:hypothetical protein